MSDAAASVLAKLGELMVELSTTDADAWDAEEVIGFADGIHMLDGIMQMAKQERVSHAG